MTCQACYTARVRNKNAENIRALGKVLSSQVRRDGWENSLSGLGTTRDKTRGASWRLRNTGLMLQSEFLDGLYVENDLVQTICGAIVEDALRAGITLRREDGGEEDATEALETLNEWHVVETVREAAIWGRLYGRAGVLLIVKGAGMFDKEMGEGGELLDLVVVDKREIRPLTWYQDPLAPKFGQPETYTLTITSSPGASSNGIVVHESRLVLFGGMLTPKRMRALNEGADFSVLTPVFDILRKVEGNFDAVCAMMSDMSQGVIKMKGLIEAVAAGRSEDLAARIQLMDQMRSVTRSVLLDAEDEDFKYVERGAISGVGDLLDKSWTRLAKVADMPVTRLMGISPSGMNATGESDRIFWYDRVRAFQRQVLKPAMEKLVGLLLGDGWEVCFPDLEAQDALEEAQIMQAQAAADSAYFTMGALTPSEIAMVRFGKGKWEPGYNGVDMEPHEAALEREHEELVNPPEPALDPGAEGEGPTQGGGTASESGTKKAEAGSTDDSKGAKGGSA